MQSLFPVGNHGQQNQPLYQFRAGKCQIAAQPNGKFLVSADLRRGQVQLVRGQDTLLHFRWCNFATGAVEDDRIVMPGECALKRVRTGRPDDRVYLLKFSYNVNNQNQLMFWMQDKDQTKDEDVVKRVNELLTNPNAAAPVPSSSNPAANALGGMLGLGGAGGGGQADLLAQLLGMNPRAAGGLGGLGGLAGLQGAPPAQQGGVPAANNVSSPPVAAPPTRPQPSSSAAGTFGGLDFSSILGQMGNATPQPPSRTAAPSSATGVQDLRRAFAQAAGTANRTPALQDILIGEEIVRSGLLNDPQVREELIAQLPPQQQTAEHLESTIRSPQLQQAITSLNDAVTPDNFHTIATNFNLNPQNGTNELMRGDTVGAFLATVQAAHPREAQSTTSNSNQEEKKQDEDDSKMQE